MSLREEGGEVEVRRADMLEELVRHIAAVPSPHPVRVAVDGIDAAGKTTLADELAAVLHAHGRPVIRASIDGFHQPRAERYRRGADSPEGYYFDAFDYPALREVLLLPLGAAGSRRYRRVVFDFRQNHVSLSPEEQAPCDAVLLMDGVFLLRPELHALWEYRIWVDVPFDVALERAIQRDVALFGSTEAVAARYHARYIPGQHLYFETAHPRERADAIVENADTEHPRLRFTQESS